MFKKTKQKLILIFILLMISLVVLSCSKEVKTDLTPGEHVTEAIFKTMEQKNMDISGNMDFELDYNKISQSDIFQGITEEMIDIINKISLQTDYKLKSDYENKMFDFLMSYDINYDASPLLSFDMLLNNDVVGLALSNFYDKYFVIDFKSIMDEMKKDADFESLSNIDFDRYLAILSDKESDAYKKIEGHDTYKKLMTAYLDESLDKGINEEVTFTSNGKEISEKVITYTFNIELESYMDFILAMLKEAKDDQDLKVYVKELTTNLLNEFIESKDYELFELTEEDVTAMNLTLDTEFDAAWDEFFAMYDELEAEMETTLSQFGDDMEMMNAVYDSMAYKISINNDQIIRAISMNLDYEGFKMNAMYHMNGFGDDVVIDKNESDSVNIMDFIDLENPDTLKNTEELAVIIKDFILSGIDEIIAGKGYVQLFKDLEAFEDELGMDMSSVSTYLEMGRVYINGMSTEEIVSMLEDSMMNTYDEFGSEDFGDDYDYSSSLSSLDGVTLLVTENAAEDDINGVIMDAISVYSMISDINFDMTITSDDAVSDNLQASIDQGSDIIFLYGEMSEDTVVSYVDLYPEVQFVLLAGYYDYYANNLTMIEYYNEEPAYVAGYIAALLSQTNTIGFVGGFEDPYTQNYEIAFTSGAQAADENIVVLVRYANSNSDYELGWIIGEDLNTAGADVVYHVAGTVGYGVIDASEQFGYQVIGNETRYGEQLDGYITSTLYDYNLIINRIFEDYDYGYVSSYYSYGVYEDALYLPNDKIPAEILDAKNELIEMISNGDLFIPAN